MRYMIHAYPGRMWYVEGYLVPKLKKQGIRAKDIVVWNDAEGKGNLRSCMDAFAWCGSHPVEGGTWHLQDDVIVCKDFKDRTENLTGDIVCGFRSRRIGTKIRRGGLPHVGGVVKPDKMWWTFQCIRIADELAGECADWVNSEEADKRYHERIVGGKDDDFFFRAFMLLKHPDTDIVNVTPNLVNHIAELIGGSSLTPLYGPFRSERFEDNGEWADAEKWIMEHRTGKGGAADE